METESPTKEQLADCYHDEMTQMMQERDMPADDHFQADRSI
jgi:hypothetical protein